MLSEELNELGIKAASGEEAEVQDRDLPGICFFANHTLSFPASKTKKKAIFCYLGLIFCGMMVYYISSTKFGVLAQLARAPRWQRGGHEFESHILHHFVLSSDQTWSDFFCFSPTILSSNRL